MGRRATTFGAYFKQMRIAGGSTLREFCAQNGFDPGNISRIERDRLPPPRGEELLRRYAEALGIRPGSDEWFEFFDRAAADAGRIPSDILSDEEVVAKLPAVFRTLRGRKLSKADLQRLVEMVRRA